MRDFRSFPLLPVQPPALLALADGTVFQGISIGAAGHTVGEVVFNTALTGYQEILTDPSYCRQIVTLTYPHIGSYGVNDEDAEATRIHAAGLIVKDVPARMSNFRATMTLPQYLQREGTVAIAGLDTRRLTRVLRTHGAQNGCIVSFDAGHAVSAEDVAAAVARAQVAPSMAGQDLARVVTTASNYPWTSTEWTLGRGFAEVESPRFHVVAYDFGVKRNILRMLASRGCRITVVPAQTPAAEVLAMNPDGVFLSNGPGDPEPCDYAISAIRELMEKSVPMFGICLGHQLMGLASGAHHRDSLGVQPAAQPGALNSMAIHNRIILFMSAPSLTPILQAVDVARQEADVAPETLPVAAWLSMSTRDAQSFVRALPGAP